MGLVWTIGRKLAALTVLMLLILAATSGFGIRGMGRMHEGFRQVAEDTTPALIQLAGTVDALHRIRVRVAGATAETDAAKIAALREEFAKQLGDLDKTWSAYTATPMSDEEHAIATTVEAGLGAYKTFLAKQWDRIAAGDAEGVRREVFGSVGTAKFREAATPLRKLLDYQSKDAAEKFAEGEVNFASDRTFSIALVLLGLVVGVALSGLIGRSISRPIHRIIAVMERLAADDSAVEVPVADRQDEVGGIARALEVFKRNLFERKRLQAEAEASAQAAASRHRSEMNSLADDLQAGVSVVVETVATASADMEGTAQTLSSLAESVAEQANGVAVAADQAAVSVQTVAAATEELSCSVAEIGRQVDQSTAIARTAVDETGRANEIVHGLSEAATRIGEIINMINDIASSTNLLALNATIEAARAGEAGKGFAVVAGEVKVLANQTARATEDIARQIEAIQSETEKAVGAIKGVGATIGQMDSIANTIAAAVDQQASATREIARNVESAALGTRAVSEIIAGVTRSIQEAGEASATVLISARRLSSESASLRKMVGGFVAKVRNS
jgi:methyl-accepting chemotaxis protein